MVMLNEKITSLKFCVTFLQVRFVLKDLCKNMRENLIFHFTFEPFMVLSSHLIRLIQTFNRNYPGASKKQVEKSN